MNIRGTDSAALAAVTDLFVAPTPARDNAAPDFQRALAPPKSNAPPQPAAQPPAAAKRDPQSQPTKAPERCEAPEQSSERDSTDEAPVVAEETTEPVAEAATEEVAETPVAGDSTENSEEVATALAVATTVAPTEQLPEQKIPQIDAEVVVETPDVEEEVAAEAAGSTDGEGLSTKPILVTCTTEEPVTPISFVGTETTTEVVAEQALVTTEQAAVAAATEGSEQSAGIGVMPSALEPQAAKAAVKANAPRPTTNRAATKVQDKSESTKASTEATTSATSAEATATEAAGATTSAPAINSEDNSERKTKQSEQPTPIATPPATMQQPSEQTTAAEAKVEAPAPPPDVPVVSELHSTQQQTPDGAKQTTQPIANQAITQRLPAHAVMRTTPQQPTPPPLHVDAARFLNRVAKAFEVASERGGEIRLRLSPPELGALRVEVNLSEHGLAARVEVENSDARTILLENLPALRERLAEQGLRLEKFDVDLSQRESSQQSSQFSEQPRDRNQPREARNMNTTVKQTAPTQANPSSTPTSGWQDRQLNVIV